MIQDDGVSVPDRATAAEPEVSALRDGNANADILNPLPDTETQEIMTKLGDLQAYLALNAHRLDKDAGRAIDIVQEARSFIITRKEKI